MIKMSDLNFLMRLRYDANETNHVKDLVGGYTLKTTTNGSNDVPAVAMADPFGRNEAIDITTSGKPVILYQGGNEIKQPLTIATWAKCNVLNEYDSASLVRYGSNASRPYYPLSWYFMLRLNNNINRWYSSWSFGTGAESSYSPSYDIMDTKESAQEWHYYEISVEKTSSTSARTRVFLDGHLIKDTKGYAGSQEIFLKKNNIDMVVGGHSDGTIGKVGIFDFVVIDGIWHTEDYDVPTGYVSMDKKGIVISNAPINLLDKTSVTGITTTGVEPTGTSRHVAFKVDDVWNKVTVGGGVASLVALTEQNITADSLILEGNTPAELATVTSVPGFVGKLIYPAVALFAPQDATVMPTFGMTIDAEVDTTVDTYTYTDYSQEYSLGDVDVPIVSCVAETTTTGNGTVAITARLKQGGVWSEYMSLEDVQMQEASAIQFKAVYTVQTTSGADSCKIDKVTVTYNTAGAVVSDATTDIVTITQEFTNDLVYVRAYAKHAELKDAVIKAYCSLRKTPQKRTLHQIGNGTGAAEVYQLQDTGINQDTLMVYVDGNYVSDFNYNTETSQVGLTAPSGAVVAASYEYGWELSDWIEMTQGSTQKNDSGLYTTEYTYVTPTHEQSLTVTAVKFALERPEGTVTNETIGVGTGKRQQFYLPHIAKKETIECTGQWNFNQDRNLLTVIMPEGEDIVVSYDWIAETPELHAVSAGWAED